MTQPALNRPDHPPQVDPRNTPGLLEQRQLLLLRQQHQQQPSDSPGLPHEERRLSGGMSAANKKLCTAAIMKVGSSG